MATGSFHAHHRLACDAALRRAFATLVDPAERAAFGRLLALVRARSDLMAAAPRVIDRAPRFRQVEAVRNLARHHRELRGSLDDWAGARGHPLAIVASLARAAFDGYPTPRFLASVWFGGDGEAEREPRRWFVAIASGRSVRGLGLPVALTRRMAHVFLTTADHVEVLPALRRAEVRGLGGTEALADAVVATRLGGDFADGELWRTVLAWLVRCGDAVDLAQVGPVIDYVDGLRRGVVASGPRATTLSLRGRTFASVMRDVAGWHRALGLRRGRGSWPRSRWQPYHTEAAQPDGRRVHWDLVELFDRDRLRHEGRAMHHCVAGYGNSCAEGRSSIWSLHRRVDTPESVGVARSWLTVEVDPRTATIVQVRGFANRRAHGHAAGLVRAWAAREQLALATSVARDLAAAGA
jgi:hypothetical protein